MQLDSTFTVIAPVDTVWATLMDFERVAGCVPGAQILNRLSDDAYQVGMKVKLGPVTMQYRGQMNGSNGMRSVTARCSMARPRRPAARAPHRRP